MRDATAATRLEVCIGRMEALVGRLEALGHLGVAPEPTDPAAIEAADRYIKQRKHELGLLNDYEEA